MLNYIYHKVSLSRLYRPRHEDSANMYFRISRETSSAAGVSRCVTVPRELLTVFLGLFICMHTFIAMFTTAYLFKRTNYQIDGGKAFVTLYASPWSSLCFACTEINEEGGRVTQLHPMIL